MATVVRRLRARLERPDPPRPEALLRSVLEPGERLLWCGRPRPYPFGVGATLMVLGTGAFLVLWAFWTVVGTVLLITELVGGDGAWA